jgi:hypothetical protein
VKDKKEKNHPSGKEAKDDFQVVVVSLPTVLDAYIPFNCGPRMFEFYSGDGCFKYGIEKVQSDTGLVRQVGFNIRLSCNRDSHRGTEKLKESSKFRMLPQIFDRIRENF